MWKTSFSSTSHSSRFMTWHMYVVKESLVNHKTIPNEFIWGNKKGGKVIVKLLIMRNLAICFAEWKHNWGIQTFLFEDLQGRSMKKRFEGKFGFLEVIWIRFARNLGKKMRSKGLSESKTPHFHQFPGKTEILIGQKREINQNIPILKIKIFSFNSILINYKKLCLLFLKKHKIEWEFFR